jgi:hypothetical protein
MKKSVKFDENYYLVSQEVNSNVTVEVAKKTNHILVVDVSGSMSYELPLIRTQLKNKLSNLMKDGDTISIVWFSGSRDAGILKEEVEVKSLKTLSDLNDAIDKWLRPVGLTAFLKPLQLVKELVDRIKKNRPDSVFSMIFLTDGYNNDCPWNEVTKALKDLENDVVSSTFVEYGYYADSRRLTEMASILGGEKISTSSFDDYEPVFDNKISSTIRGGKKTLVEITDSYLYDFVFSVGDDGSVLLYNITDKKVMVGGDVKEIYFFNSKQVGEPLNYDKPLYAAIYVLSDKLLNDDAERIFYALGDNYYYKMLANAYGKQKLMAFKASIKDCISDVSKRFPEGGKATIQKVDDNAYCLMNLINDLGNIEGCLFYPNHPDFKYNRIGRKKVAKGSDLSDADKKLLAEAKNVDEANKILAELAEKNVDLKFETTDKEAGYRVTDLVWNEERANLSLRIRIDGNVKLPTNKFKIEEVATYKYNTFTLVKDGIVNVDKLPVSYSHKLNDILTEKGVVFDDLEASNNSPRMIIINLSSIPIVNKGMIKGISAVELATQEWNLVKLQAEKKVYDYFRKIVSPKTSKSFVEMLGQEAADWLKEIGITEFNGFAPKVTSAEATDFYMSVVLATKIKGYSSLPKVEDVINKIKDNKPFKPTEALMSQAIINYTNQTQSELFKSLDVDSQNKVLGEYLVKKTAELNVAKKAVLQKIANIKFSLILSKKWFNEFKTFEENKLSLKLDGVDLDFTFDLSEAEEKI